MKGVNGCKWSPEGDMIAVTLDDGNVLIYSARDDRPKLWTLKGHSANAICVDWSPDGTRVVTGKIQFFGVSKIFGVFQIFRFEVSECLEF